VKRLLALLLVAACSSNGGDPFPPGWTLVAPGIRVEILRDPYRLRVLDAAGDPLLESAGAGAADGYATLGWTTGTIQMTPYISPGYTKVFPNLDPWRDQLNVVAATATETSLELTLATASPTDARVIVTHTLRPSTLRVEARLEGTATARAWSTAFQAPAGEGYLGSASASRAPTSAASPCTPGSRRAASARARARRPARPTRGRTARP
jgi:hypothetical protein